MGAQFVSMISLLVASAAVWVAIWQIRVNTRQTERLNSLPVLYSAFAEFRSPEFRAHVDNVMRNIPGQFSGRGFETLPPDWTESAFTVCYLYDYLGGLMAHKLVDERIIVGTFATQAVQVWSIVEPFILAEREHRKTTYSPFASPGFLQYYEHLVERIVQLGGRDAPARIRAAAGVLTLDAPLNRSAFRPGQD
jgi:hypothetical protein